MISLASFRLMLLLLNTAYLYSVHYQYDPRRSQSVVLMRALKGLA